MKVRILIFLFCLLCTFGLRPFAQGTLWGKLTIPLPQGWSSNMKAGNLIYSNYNLGGGAPFSITLFKPEAITGKTDSLFQDGWKKYMSGLATTSDIPRPKKWVTSDELPLFTASKEITGQAFYVFGIYLLGEQYQAFLLETTNAKTYREVQSEWQERLLEVKMATVKKR